LVVRRDCDGVSHRIFAAAVVAESGVNGIQPRRPLVGSDTCCGLRPERWR